MLYLWFIFSEGPFHVTVSNLSPGCSEIHTEMFSSSNRLESDAIGKFFKRLRGRKKKKGKKRNICSPSAWFLVPPKETAIYIDCWRPEKEDSIHKQNLSRRIYNTYYSTLCQPLTHLLSFPEKAMVQVTRKKRYFIYFYLFIFYKFV